MHTCECEKEPCNAWCRPDEGIHVDLDYVLKNVSLLGHERIEGILNFHKCYCRGCKANIEIISITPAPEAPSLNERYGPPKFGRKGCSDLSHLNDLYEAEKVVYRLIPDDEL